LIGGQAAAPAPGSAGAGRRWACGLDPRLVISLVPKKPHGFIPMPSENNIIELRGVSKVYPGVLALNKISFHLAPGEVVGLVGENGAGKSTFLKILGGIIRPSHGEIFLENKRVAHLTVQDSQAAGIAFVHQELNLFDNLDVTANVFMGREERSRILGFVDTKSMAARVQLVLNKLGVAFRPETRVSAMSLAERQLLEIARALSMDAKILILDEPTSSLNIRESQKLLSIIGDLKAQGVAIIFVSHRLHEVEACADRVVVFRDGCNAGELDKASINHDAMVSLMIGRNLAGKYLPPVAAVRKESLWLNAVQTQTYPDAQVFLTAYAGEILGLAGLMGAGRTELARAIFGLDEIVSGEIVANGVPLTRRTPATAIRQGIYLVPEDRKLCGLVTEMSVTHNITLPNLGEFARLGLVDHKEEAVCAARQRENLGIKTASLTDWVAGLSGGNQQKVVLAKWLAMNPKIMIFDEPTRGIDVGSKAEIYKLMRKLSDHGVAVIVISSDMEEIITVSDRVAVMHAGAISGILSRENLSEFNVLQLAVGSKAGVACS
jgi:ribose transport system ATP-binding protein